MAAYSLVLETEDRTDKIENHDIKNVLYPVRKPKNLPSPSVTSWGWLAAKLPSNVKAKHAGVNPMGQSTQLPTTTDAHFPNQTAKTLLAQRKDLSFVGCCSVKDRC